MKFPSTLVLTLLNMLLVHTFGKIQPMYNELEISNKVTSIKDNLMDVFESTQTIKKFYRDCREGFYLTPSGECRPNVEASVDYITSGEDIVDETRPVKHTAVDVPQRDQPCDKYSRRLLNGRCRVISMSPTVNYENY